MEKFIKVCDSSYGTRTCIYRYINPNQIVSLKVEITQCEVNVEATLTNGMRVIILKQDDLKELVGEKNCKEIDEIIKELCDEEKLRRYL